MKVQACLLSAAIAAALTLTSAPATAAGFNKAAAATRAQGLIKGPAARLVHRASADRFVATDANRDRNGTEHVRFHRTYRGLPVIGGDFIVHSRNGRVEGISGTLRSSVRPSLSARVSRSRAIGIAGARFGKGFEGRPQSHLVVYALGAQPVLAHEVVYKGFRTDQTPTEMHYFVDARNGRILNQWDAIETARPGRDRNTCRSPTAAVGTGNSLAEGTVSLDTADCGSNYQLKDLTRGGGYTTNMSNRKRGKGSIFTDSDNVWGTGALNNSQTVAADAHYGVATTWDYYLNIHGRNGIADDGQGALSRVHYGRNYVNAFWLDNCFCMTFGDGDNGVTYNPLVALDVAGHEMSHGVTSHTAELVYSGEPGGLNEATSDIMGTMVEFYASNANDPGDYVIGENVYANNPDGTLGLRWMFKPSIDGTSPDCYASDLGDLNVHYSSGVANHFFYLLAEGAVVPAGFGAGTSYNLTAADLVCNGNTAIAGIGRAKAEQIWYIALRDYMSSGTDYAGARTATLSAATDLYGNPSAEYAAVAAAWDAVSVLSGAP